jgi:KUP system potassium uptake protein
MTTMLLSYYLLQMRVRRSLISVLLITYTLVEGSFLVANLHKFAYGGWFTLLLATFFFTIMYGWYFGRKLKNRYVSFANLKKYTELFKDLANDNSVPKTATNLVYIIKANRQDQVESKIIYSIFQKQPKRANTYWFVHIDTKDEPYTFEYKVTHLIPGVLIRVDFNLGFKVEPHINLYFREVLEDLKNSGEFKNESSFKTIQKNSLQADFLFVLVDRVMSDDNKLSRMERIVLALHKLSRLFCISDVSAFNLDSTITIEEKVPIIKEQPEQPRIKRIGLKTEPVAQTGIKPAYMN